MQIAVIRRYGAFATFAAILLLAAPLPALAGTGNANFFLGAKFLDEGDWEPLENQTEFGAEVTFGPSHWPVLIAIDVFGSGAEDTVSGVDFDATTSEIDFGVRKIWELRRVRPYVGGGIGLVFADLEGSYKGDSISDDDTGIGAWVGGGVFWRLGTRFNIGIAARYSKAEVTIFDVDAEAGGFHLGMLLGWGWPVYK